MEWNKINKKRTKDVLDYYKYLYPYKIKNKIRNDLDENSIFAIFSAPRGGSTWLAELLLTIPRSSLVWEPLFRHPKKMLHPLNPFSFPEIKNIGIWWNQHIPENSDWPEAYYYFDKLFKRKMVNLKLYQYNKELKKISKSNTFIYKFCFGNLLLPWLLKNFNLKTIVLVRHPCAVISSQLKHESFKRMLKSNPHYNVPEWMKYKDFYHKYRYIYEHIKIPEQKLAFNWALSTSYLINHPMNNNGWLTVSYESLLNNPELEINRIFKYLGKDIPDELMSNFNKPSIMTFKKNYTSLDPKKQISAWRDNLNHYQIESIFNILRELNIKYYEPEKDMPEMNMLYN